MRADDLKRRRRCTTIMQYKKERRWLVQRSTPRVMLRHPELSEKDVLHAWEHAIASLSRVSKNPDEYVSLGFDGRGRLLEVVGVRGDGGNWLLYHAMTPPSDKTYREFGLGR